MIALVDYGRGNLFSLGQALRQIDAEHSVTNRKDEILNAACIILPGVGAFEDAMRSLLEMDLVEPLLAAAARGTPILGICLGMQLLMSRSEEFGIHTGLDLVAGSVIRLPAGDSIGPMRVPNVGWRRIRVRATNPLIGDAAGKNMFYFNHSFVPSPDSTAHIVVTTDFNDRAVAAIIRRENVMGTQFHPEKSAAAGLTLLRRFVEFSDHA